MLSCDLISASEKKENSEIILISDDTDFFPSLALSSTKLCKKEQKITVLIKNKFKFENYKIILEQFGIIVKINEYLI